MTPIAQILLDIVKNLFAEANIDSVSLDVPPKNELGDFAFNVFPYAKITRLAPPVIGEKVAEALRENAEYFKNVSVTGGYVNFFVTEKGWAEILVSLTTINKQKRNETIVVDYIGANTGKPLHIGHICTPSIGQAIINTHEYLGYEVISDSHFGDWGGIFGKLIYAWRYPPIYLSNFKWLSSDEYDLEKLTRLREKGVSYLMELYQLAFQLVAEDDHGSIEEDSRRESQFLSWIGINLDDPEQRKHHEENVELWKKFTAVSIAEVQKKLELLGIRAKYNIGESFYEWLNLPRPNNEDYSDLLPEETMKSVVKELVKKGVATENEDGSVGVIFPEETKIPSCVLQKKDGTGLYLTSDLAAIKYRLRNWKPSKIVYCIDVRQQLHLKQAFNIAHRAWDNDGLNKTELFHAFNGFIKLKEGAMSTRKGTVIFLADLIEEGFNRTKAVLAEKGQSLPDSDIQAIAIGGIKYSYLAQDREKDVVFDWDKALNLEGNSGPYIQYAYVRAKNILEKAGEIPSFKEEGLELSEHDKNCLRELSFFEKAVVDSASKYKPHILALYCYSLAVAFNGFYVHTPKILEEKDENLRAFRLTLIGKTVETLAKGFELLAIPMPSKM